MKKTAFLSALALLAAALSGCATAGKNILHVTSDPVSAKVVVFDRAGNALGETTTPVSFMIKNEYACIEISNEGYTPQRIVIGRDIKKKFNPLYLLNFAVAAGGIGMGIGLNHAAADSHDNHFTRTVSYYAFGIGALGVLGAIIDPFSGSVTKTSPESVHIRLEASPHGRDE
jgi:hypothetical protein